MTNDELDTYEAKLRQKAQPSSAGLVLYISVLLGITLLVEGLAWLFWSKVFGP